MNHPERDITTAAKIVANQFRNLDDLLDEYKKQNPNIPLKGERFVLEGPVSLRVYGLPSVAREQYNKMYRLITQQLYRGGQLRVKILAEVCKQYDYVYLHHSSFDGVFRIAEFRTKRCEFHFKLRV
jgi:hypothetical protein